MHIHTENYLFEVVVPVPTMLLMSAPPLPQTHLAPHVPSSPTALYQRALVYSALGRNSEARADIKQAVRFIGADAALTEAQEVTNALR